MSENTAEGQQRDFGFRRFLEKEGQNYKISQRTSDGLTLVELLIPSVDKGISLMERGKSGADKYAILAKGRLVGAKSEWPPKVERGNKPPQTVNAIIVGRQIRTHELDDTDGFLVGIWEGCDDRGKFVLADNDEKTFHYLLDSAPYLPDINIHYASNNGKRILPKVVFKEVPDFVGSEHGWTEPQFTEPSTFTYRGKRYSLERSSGIATVVVESPKDIVEVSFPERLDELEISGFKTFLMTDIDWFHLLTVKPILHYSRIPKPDGG